MAKQNTTAEGQMNFADIGWLHDDDNGRKLEVVRSEFIGPEDKSWQELFCGYDELYAITFSSGLDFTTRLLSEFNYCEVIFGHPGVISPTMENIMAAQAGVIKGLAKSKRANELVRRIEDHSLGLYVAKDHFSHEKIYCLSSKSGKRRVITGSANMSFTAFSGKQRENITYFDGEKAYDYFIRLFEDFRDTCSDTISYKTLLAQMTDSEHIEDHIEEIPIVKEIEKKEAIFIEPGDEIRQEEAALSMDVRKLADQLKPMIPRPKKENGKPVITAENIKKFKKSFKQKREEDKAKNIAFPKLHLDYDTGELSFNGSPFNMTPTDSEIKNDIDCVLSHMSSFEAFEGGRSKIAKAQELYFDFFNWCFASIFMPKLRTCASQTHHNLNDFPVFGILNGKSNGGKTSFAELCLRLMTGKETPKTPNDGFTATNVSNLKRGCEGVPILVDDLVKSQYVNNAEKIIKDDFWGLEDGFLNYPAVIITTNNVPSVESALSKRMVVKNIPISIDKEPGAKNAKKIISSLSKAGTALFSEYVRRMLPKVSEMIDMMRNDGDEYFPDIFKISSETIIEIFREYADTPEYIRPVSYSDYFGDKAIGRNAIKTIIDAYESDPKAFTIDKKKGLLKYTVPESKAYTLRYLVDELPARLNAFEVGKTITMDLAAAQEFFGKKFMKTFLGKYI